MILRTWFWFRSQSLTFSVYFWPFCPYGWFPWKIAVQGLELEGRKLDLSSHSKASGCTCEPVVMKSGLCSEKVMEKLETTCRTRRGNKHMIPLINHSSRINDQLYFWLERFWTLIEAWRLMLLIEICFLQMKSKKRKTHTSCLIRS